MTTGSHALTQQVGSKGYFARVSVTVEEADLPNCEVDFAGDNSSIWAAGAIFGAIYAWEIYLRSKPAKSGLRVRIVELEGVPADTSNLVVAYVSAFAVWSALAWQPTKLPTFDPKTGFFCFSKS
jgi:hypothetical protein